MLSLILEEKKSAICSEFWFRFYPTPFFRSCYLCRFECPTTSKRPDQRPKVDVFPLADAASEFVFFPLTFVCVDDVKSALFSLSPWEEWDPKGFRSGGTSTIASTYATRLYIMRRYISRSGRRCIYNLKQFGVLHKAKWRSGAAFGRR